VARNWCTLLADSRMGRRMSELAKWDNFYVIVGSASGALIGLQFVVLTLIAQRPSSTVAEGGAAFASPTIVHFSVVLLLSAIVQAPWQTIGTVSSLWGVLGIAGVAYSLIVARRMRRQPAYKPVAEDWAFHFFSPLVAYILLALSSVAARSQTREALFGLAGGALILLFTAIHNSWDSVTYHVWSLRPRTASSADKKTGESGARQPASSLERSQNE